MEGGGDVGESLTARRLCVPIQIQFPARNILEK
jgi:hypothetical protein